MSYNMSKYPIAVIHGRFQILHHDHLKYLLAGKELCEHLIIGITNPDPSLTKYTKTNPHRSTKIANPLTYYERYLLIRDTLIDQELDITEFSIVPFPINTPELYHHYVPLDAVFFLTIYDDWGREKKKMFEKLGLKIQVLWEGPLEEKGVNGTDIRDLILKGENWDHFVPHTVTHLLTKWDIRMRLKKIRESQ